VTCLVPHVKALMILARNVQRGMFIKRVKKIKQLSNAIMSAQTHMFKTPISAFVRMDIKIT